MSPQKFGPSFATVGGNRQSYNQELLTKSESRVTIKEKYFNFFKPIKNRLIIKINITINLPKKIENKLNISSKDVSLFKKKVFNERDVRKKILKKFFKIFICSYRSKSALLKFVPGYNEGC